MKTMLIAATVLGTAIAGLVLYGRTEPANLKARQLRDKARKILLNTEGQNRSRLQTMG